jgi:PAS domain S-box-containing protein
MSDVFADHNSSPDPGEASRLKEALQHSEERFRLVTAATQGVIYDWDAQSNRVERFANLFEMLGIPSEEVESSPQWWMQLVHPDDISSTRQTVEQALSDGSPSYSVEYRMQHRDGHLIYVWDRARIVRDDTGKLLRVVGHTVDITEKKCTEQDMQQSEARLRGIFEQLHESEARFRNMADTAPVLLWVSGTNGDCTWFNKPWLDFVGRTLEQEVGNGWTENVHPDDFDFCLRTYREAFAAKRPFEMDYRLLRHDGQHRWVLDQAVPRFTPGGEFLGYIGSCVDITERKRAEAAQHALASAGALLATSLDFPTTLHNVARLPLPHFADYCTLDLFEDDGSLRQAAVAHSDSAKEPLLREWRQLNPHNDVLAIGAAAVAHSREAQLCSQVTDELLSIYTNDNRSLEIFRALQPLSYLIQPLNARGRIIGTLSFVTTGTSRRYTGDDLAFARELAERAALAVDNARLYQQAQQAQQQAEEASRTKDEFLATVSHELRTPLNAIIGWAHLLQSGQLDNAAAEHAMEVIGRNARVQAQIVNDLLDVSRIITGKLRLEATPTELSPVVQAATDAVHSAAQAKSLHLEVAYKAKNLQVLGDSTRLQQVLWNLLSNAVRFTPDSGRIEVRVSRVMHAPSADQLGRPYARIDVIDSGQGIAPQFLPYVFDRFRQADSTSTRKHGGLGLGLAIVRHIVEMHGGTVEAHSEGQGRGATFSVLLPLMPPRSTLSMMVPPEILGRNSGQLSKGSAPNSLAEIPARVLEGLRILVVDDQSDSREIVVDILQRYGAKMSSAASAPEALDMLLQQPPDLLIADIGMPGEDGYSLIEKIRALPASSGGAVLAITLTAFARSEDRERALSAGFQEHITKPVAPHELITFVARVVGRM